MPQVPTPISAKRPRQASSMLSSSVRVSSISLRFWRRSSLQLSEFARRFLVDGDDFADLGDRETDTPAAQDFLDEPAVCRAEQTRAATAFWMDQTFVFVEAKRPRRNTKFARQLRYAIVFVHRHRIPTLSRQ
jgi:hypothetical protein